MSPDKKNYTLWFVVGGIIAFLFIVIVGVFVGVSIMSNAIKNAQVTPTPEPTVVLEPTIVIQANKFATDPGVLKIRDDLKTVLGKIDSVDLFEPQIAPPAVDLGLNIK